MSPAPVSWLKRSSSPNLTWSAERFRADHSGGMPRNGSSTSRRAPNSTPEPDGHYRTYFLRVPNLSWSARDGVAWTFGLREQEYAPSVET